MSLSLNVSVILILSLVLLNDSGVPGGIVDGETLLAGGAGVGKDGMQTKHTLVGLGP